MGDQPDLSAFASLRDWEGKRESVSDVLHPTPVRALATTLDQDGVDADAGHRSRRCGTGSTSCRSRRPRGSGPTATPAAEASCLRCRWSDACGLVGG